MKTNDENQQREERIQKMKEEIQKLSGGTAVFGPERDYPLHIKEAFYKSVLEFERAHSRPNRDKK